MSSGINSSYRRAAGVPGATSRQSEAPSTPEARPLKMEIVHVFEIKRLHCCARRPNMAACFIVREGRISYVTAHEVFDHDVPGIFYLGRLAAASVFFFDRTGFQLVAESLIHECLRHRFDYGDVFQQSVRGPQFRRGKIPGVQSTRGRHRHPRNRLRARSLGWSGVGRP